MLAACAGESGAPASARPEAPTARVEVTAPESPAAPAPRADADEAPAEPAFEDVALREPGAARPSDATNSSGAPAPAAPSGPPAETAALLALPLEASTSIRGPNDGALEHGVAFPDRGPGFRFNPRRRPEARYGAVEVVQALVRAAMTVHRELPGGELTMNDLGFEGGGPISHHESHQAGRDADVLFYLFGEDGRPIPSVGAPLDPSGEGVDFRDLAIAEDDVPVHIDAARTFRYIRALLEDEHAAVQRIFLAEHLRTILLAEAHRAGAPAEVIARFEDVTCQPGSPHDDHFHVRFFCAPDDVARGCEDSRPIYPWQRAALRALGLTPVAARPRRDRPRAPVVSASEARAAAGPMHPDVVRWLERRAAWLPTPHPGRRYCR
jgi:penicillin-insensitive murein endopeptidase